MVSRSATSTPENPKHVDFVADLIEATTEECTLCRATKAAPDFQLFIQFGRALAPRKRRQIEDFVHSLFRNDPHDNDDSELDNEYSLHESRKRRHNHNDDDGDGDSRQYQIRKRRKLSDGATRTPTTDYDRVRRTLVLYSSDFGFALDTTGDGLSNGRRVLYDRATTDVMGARNDPLSKGNACFNCAMTDHELRDCPLPIDRTRVEESRRAFQESSESQFNSRFYIVKEEEKHTDEMRKRFRPGVLSNDLRLALGMAEGDEAPEFVTSMYYNGYPPAYLGRDEADDPMHARGIQEQKLPQTPELNVYGDLDDYSDANDDGMAKESNAVDADTKEGNEIREGESDNSNNNNNNNNNNNKEEGEEEEEEDGAISEGEVDNSDHRAALEDRIESNSGVNENETSVTTAPRNIPLVKYPGLDLSEFEFSGPTPGKPLYPRTPHRGPNEESGNYNSHDSYYPEYSDDRHCYSDHQRRRQRRQQQRNQYRHSPRYKDRADNYYGYDDRSNDWDSMLRGYYNDYSDTQNTSQTVTDVPGYNQQQGYSYYSQPEYGYYQETPPSPPPPPPLYPIPPQKPDWSIESRSAEDSLLLGLAQGNCESSNVPERRIGLEDGECDMDMSD